MAGRNDTPLSSVAFCTVCKPYGQISLSIHRATSKKASEAFFSSFLVLFVLGDPRAEYLGRCEPTASC